MNRIAIIGCGALSRTLIRIVKEKLDSQYTISGVFSRNTENTKQTAAREHLAAYRSVQEMIEDRPDTIIELASADAVRDYGTLILQSGINLIVASTGALADQTLLAQLTDTARASGCRIYIASGAAGGFDLMRTFSLAEPTAVTITTCKSPDSLSGAPFLNNRVLSADHEEVVFSGDARAAIEAFPKNVNVAISTALACDAIDTLKVCVLSEPKISCNAHTIVLSNSFADAAIRISSRPDSGNPRSSVITAWSIAALLQNLANTVQYF